MSDLNISGMWNTIKGKLTEAYDHLTEDDLHFAEGKEHELIAKLQDKLGKTKEEVEEMIHNFKK